ncbi:MAG: TadE/TadG family type IV pilus assembly protein [Cypionkella sp.]
MLKLKSLLKRFGRDESGALVAETVIVLPLLFWAYLALFVYWDAYRSINTSQKAAFTISDMISREMNAAPLPASYVTGMRDMMAYLVDPDQTVRLRVSSVTWSQTNNRYEVDWSKTTDSVKPALTTSSVSSYKDQIPKLADGDHVIIVESWVDYHPAFKIGGDFPVLKEIGLNDMVMQQFVVTRPRFTPKICMTGFACT